MKNKKREIEIHLFHCFHCICHDLSKLKKPIMVFATQKTIYAHAFIYALPCHSLAVLEGIAISFNPNYKVLSSSYPWIARKVLTDSSPQLRSTLQALLYKVNAGPSTHPSVIFVTICFKFMIQP